MRLNQVTVPVTDVRRSVEFYTWLGLNQIVVDRRPCRSLTTLD